MNSDTLEVLSWNLWYGGAQIEDARAKQLAILKEYVQGPTPIVLIQESVGAAQELAAELGWNVIGGIGTAIITPCPLEPVAALEPVPNPEGMHSTGALVDTPGGSVLVFSIHLESSDYGPYFVADYPQKVPNLTGELRRTEQAQLVLARAERLVSERPGLPVIIGGDWNVPTTSDWAAQPEHQAAIKAGLSWGASDAMTAAGFTDAFRACWPDAQAVPGITWSMIEPEESEPRDRIDVIYTSGFSVHNAVHLGGGHNGAGQNDAEQNGAAQNHADATSVADLMVVPGPHALIPDHRQNAWPSDHQAVLTRIARC